MARGAACIFLLLCILYTLPAAFSQSTTDSTRQNAALSLGAGARQAYHHTIREQAPIFTGSEYFGYTGKVKGHPFYLSDLWENGSVTFDGVTYTAVPLLYDIANEAVVVVRPGEQGVPYKIQIATNKVQSFTAKGRFFTRLDSAEQDMPTGFYERMYAGGVQVLAKRVKTSLKQSAGLTFNQKDTYFIFKNGQYYPVKSKGSVLKVFSDKKAELSKLMKTEGIDFAQNKEAAMIRLAKAYDLLNAQP